MPFVNNQQRKACYAKRNQALKMGTVPKWDCDKWERETMKECGEKCKNGNFCKRKTLNKKCWQHL
jgi:hypothetical protein